eukprot:tig00000269_g23774.t1
MLSAMTAAAADLVQLYVTPCETSSGQAELGHCRAVEIDAASVLRPLSPTCTAETRAVSPGRAAAAPALGIPLERLLDADEVVAANSARQRRERRGSLSSRPGDVVRVEVKELRFPEAADTAVVVRWNGAEVARSPPVERAAFARLRFAFVLKITDGEGELRFEALRRRGGAGAAAAVEGAFAMPLAVVAPGEQRELWLRFRPPAGSSATTAGAALLRIEHSRERVPLGRASVTPPPRPEAGRPAPGPAQPPPSAPKGEAAPHGAGAPAPAPSPAPRAPASALYPAGAALLAALAAVALAAWPPPAPTGPP